MSYDGTPFSSFVETTKSSDSAPTARPASDAPAAGKATAQPVTGVDSENTLPPEKQVGAEGYQADKDARAEAARAARPADQQPKVEDGHLSDEGRALRAERKAESLYSAQDMFRDLIPASEDWSENNIKAAQEFRELAADFRLGTADVEQLAATVKHDDEGYTLPMDAEARAAGAAEMKVELQRQYGSEWRAVLDQASRHVAKVSPALFAWLNETGYGDSPVWIRAAIAASRSRGGK